MNTRLAVLAFWIRMHREIVVNPSLPLELRREARISLEAFAKDARESSLQARMNEAMDPLLSTAERVRALRDARAIILGEIR